MKMLITESQLIRVILKESVPPTEKEKQEQVENTKVKLKTIFQKLNEMFSSITTFIRNNRNNKNKKIQAVATKYNRMLKLSDILKKSLNSENLVRSFTTSGFSNFLYKEMEELLEVIKLLDKNHKLNFKNLVNDVKNLDFEGGSDIFDNKNCCRPKDLNSFNGIVNNFISNLDTTNNNIKNKIERYEN